MYDTTGRVTDSFTITTDVAAGKTRRHESSRLETVLSVGGATGTYVDDNANGGVTGPVGKGAGGSDTEVAEAREVTEGMSADAERKVDGRENRASSGNVSGRIHADGNREETGRAFEYCELPLAQSGRGYRTVTIQDSLAAGIRRHCIRRNGKG